MPRELLHLCFSSLLSAAAGTCRWTVAEAAQKFDLVVVLFQQHSLALPTNYTTFLIWSRTACLIISLGWLLDQVRQLSMSGLQGIKIR